jgi:hypothetical protein
MALQNDDWDIRKSWLYTELGGNGDYYISVVEEKKPNEFHRNTIRITTSGSRYPSEVMLAVANLHRVLRKYGLDGRELNKELEFKATIKPVNE